MDLSIILKTIIAKMVSDDHADGTLFLLLHAPLLLMMYG